MGPRPVSTGASQPKRPAPNGASLSEAHKPKTAAKSQNLCEGTSQLETTTADDRRECSDRHETMSHGLGARESEATDTSSSHWTVGTSDVILSKAPVCARNLLIRRSGGVRLTSTPAVRFAQTAVVGRRFNERMNRPKPALRVLARGRVPLSCFVAASASVRIAPAIIEAWLAAFPRTPPCPATRAASVDNAASLAT